jgi:hypothetical protein
MAEDQLKMAAVIVDGWTGPLKAMTQSLRGVAEDTKTFQREGADDARKHEGRIFLL